ncbi:MAG TPA: hypothetical protein VK932_25320, partial [Kofleriaceae bacterium]|nr:hypothetical protein [Kofleriaceae bacterium]
MARSATLPRAIVAVQAELGAHLAAKLGEPVIGALVTSRWCSAAARACPAGRGIRRQPRAGARRRPSRGARRTGARRAGHLVVVLGRGARVAVVAVGADRELAADPCAGVRHRAAHA